MNKKKTTEEFIKDACKVHGDKYLYDKVMYEGWDKKVTIVCKSHSEFVQSPNSHLNGGGCPVCAQISRSEAYKNTIGRKKDNFTYDFTSDTSKVIPLTEKFFAIVDNEDFDRVSEHNWHLSINYASNPKLGLLHRYILNVNDRKVYVDHKNHNGFDNRKSNLRLCSQKENASNQLIQNREKSSIYKGVTWDKSRNKWAGRIKHHGKGIFLGRFLNEIDAALAYDVKAKELFGEFAWLNIKDSE